MPKSRESPMLDACLYQGLRTPFGRHAGALAAVRPDDLLGGVIRALLTRNAIPYANLDVERDADVQTTLDGFGVGVDDIPVVICRGERALKKPTIEEVAGCLGLNAVNEGVVRDVVVVGAGPAGLASAVYAASEGLDALVLEAVQMDLSIIEDGLAARHRCCRQADGYG